MQITAVTPFVVDAGWRKWILVKVETDEGITGWGGVQRPGRERGDGRDS